MGVFSNIFSAGAGSAKNLDISTFPKWWVKHGKGLDLVEAMEKFIKNNKLVNPSLRTSEFDVQETHVKIEILRASKDHILTRTNIEQYNNFLDVHEQLLHDYQQLSEYSHDELDKDLDDSKDELASRFFHWWKGEKEEEDEIPITDALNTYVAENGLLDHVSKKDLLYEQELHKEKLRIFTQCESDFRPLLGEESFEQLCESCRSIIESSDEVEDTVGSNETRGAPIDINATFFDWWWAECDSHSDNLNNELNVFIVKNELEPKDDDPDEVARYAGRKMDIIIACRGHFGDHFDTELIDSFIITLASHNMNKKL